jgi:putative Ca2+/H+ antiporter (TMEM165/GDT1 family)
VTGRHPVKTYLAVFVSVFLAELGDKTQLATLLFATTPGSRAWGVFCAAALALVVSTGIAVLIGGHVARWIDPQRMKLIAAVAFVLIGVWMLFDR